MLAVIEHEDEWFALVRVDGEDEPRLFVSDLPAALRGVFADLLAPAAEVESPGAARVAAVPSAEDVVDDPTDESLENPLGDDRPEEAEPLGGLDDDEVDLGDFRDLETEDVEPAPAWAGHADLLADLGVRPEVIIELCEEHGDDPATVLAELGEHAGFGELLEALR